jgi:hypothetical protein
VILEPGKKHLFLDLSFTNTDTLVPSLYQCVETSSIEVFWLLFQPIRHNRNVSRSSLEPLYATDTSHRKYERFLYDYLLHWVLLPTKTHIGTLISGITPLKHGRHFDYWNQPLNMRMRICYLDWHEAGLCCYLVIHIDNLLGRGQTEETGNRNFRETSPISSRQLVPRLAGAHWENLSFIICSHHLKWVCSSDLMRECSF